MNEPISLRMAESDIEDEAKGGKRKTVINTLLNNFLYRNHEAHYCYFGPLGRGVEDNLLQ